MNNLVVPIRQYTPREELGRSFKAKIKRHFFKPSSKGEAAPAPAPEAAAEAPVPAAAPAPAAPAAPVTPREVVPVPVMTEQEKREWEARYETMPEPGIPATVAPAAYGGGKVATETESGAPKWLLPAAVGAGSLLAFFGILVAIGVFSSEEGK